MNILRRKAKTILFSLSVLSCCLLWHQRQTQGQVTPKVTLTPLTHTSDSWPLRRPFFVQTDKEMAGQKEKSFFVIWRKAMVDKSKAGRQYYEPRRMSWLAWNGSYFEANTSVPPVKEWETFSGAGSEVPDSEVLNLNDRSILLQQQFQGASGRGGVNLFTFDLNILTDSKSYPSWDKGLISMLPYSGKDKQYLDAYKTSLKYQQADVAKSRKKLHIVPPYFGPTPIVPTAEELKQTQEDIKSGAIKLVRPTGISIGDLIFSVEHISTNLDYSRINGTQDAKGNIWLVGLDYGLGNTDTPQNYLWVTFSKDNAKTWEARQLIGRGNFPTIVSAKNGDLLVFSTKTKQFGWQGEWPDADPKTFASLKSWPAYGTLMVQRSRDNGRTWSKPSQVVDDKLVIQNRVYQASDGRLWLVYVQSDAEQRQRTSLWLTSSKDNGATWQKPLRLTDGKVIDREPDLLWHDGHLLVVFSRGGRGINTDIWLAEIE